MTNKLTAIAMIVWLVLPFCCCSVQSVFGGVDAPVSSCCTSQPVDEPAPCGDDGDCPCGKRQLAESSGGAIPDTMHLAPDHQLVVALIEDGKGELPVAVPRVISGAAEVDGGPPPPTGLYRLFDSWLL